jgi:hygromycin-B 7''-O-kinase
MGRADVYLQPEAKDPVLSTASVLAIAAAHTDLATRVVEVDESGGEARAYLLDGDVVVKTQRPHRLRPRTSLSKEARLLDVLAAPLAGLVPVIFGYGRRLMPEGEVEYVVMSRIPGRAARHVPITGSPRAVLLYEVGALLARLHALPTAPLRTDDSLFPLDSDGAALGTRLAAGFADLLDVIEQQPDRWPLPMRPEDVVTQALAMLPPTFTPVALHSNPGPTHVFVDGDGTFTGLIDFGDSYLSHPAMDLRAWPDPADRLALRAGYLRDHTPSAEFDQAWAVAMIYTDLGVLASRPELAGAAAADVALRLAGSPLPG